MRKRQLDLSRAAGWRESPPKAISPSFGRRHSLRPSAALKNEGGLESNSEAASLLPSLSPFAATAAAAAAYREGDERRKRERQLLLRRPPTTYSSSPTAWLT